MASILVMGGFAPAIGILGGGELGGEGVPTGDEELNSQVEREKMEDLRRGYRTGVGRGFPLMQ
jgi:hypothetical protein